MNDAWQLCRTIGPLLSQRFLLASAKAQPREGFLCILVMILVLIPPIYSYTIFRETNSQYYHKSLIISETFLYNFTHGYLGRHLKSTETHASTCQNSNNQVCLHELTSTTFQSVVMDPEKVCCFYTHLCIKLMSLGRIRMLGTRQRILLFLATIRNTMNQKFWSMILQVVCSLFAYRFECSFACYPLKLNHFCIDRMWSFSTMHPGVAFVLVLLMFIYRQLVTSDQPRTSFSPGMSIVKMVIIIQNYNSN